MQNSDHYTSTKHLIRTETIKVTVACKGHTERHSGCMFPPLAFSGDPLVNPCLIPIASTGKLKKQCVLPLFYSILFFCASRKIYSPTKSKTLSDDTPVTTIDFPGIQ